MITMFCLYLWYGYLFINGCWMKVLNDWNCDERNFDKRNSLRISIRVYDFFSFPFYISHWPKILKLNFWKNLMNITIVGEQFCNILCASLRRVYYMTKAVQPWKGARCGWRCSYWTLLLIHSVCYITSTKASWIVELCLTYDQNIAKLLTHPYWHLTIFDWCSCRLFINLHLRIFPNCLGSFQISGNMRSL